MKYSNKFIFLATSSVSTNGSISVFDGQTGARMNLLPCQKIANNSIAIIQDFVICCVENKSLLEIYQYTTDGKKKVISLPAPARAIVYNETLNILACFLGFDIYMWQPSTGKLLTILGKIHSYQGTHILFTEKNNVITIDESGLIVFWRIDLTEFPEVLWKSRPFGISKVHCTILENERLFVATDNGKLIILSLADGCPSMDLINLSLNIHCVLSHHDNVFIGCSKGILMVFSISEEQIINQITLKDCTEINEGITNLVLTPNKQILVAILNECTAFKINIFEFFMTGCHLSLVQNMNNLVTIPKLEHEVREKFIIKRLNFSLDEPCANEVEVYLGPKDPVLKATDIINQRDFSLDEIYFQMMSKVKGNFNDEDEKNLKNLKKNLFCILQK